MIAPDHPLLTTEGMRKALAGYFQHQHTCPKCSAGEEAEDITHPLFTETGFCAEGLDIIWEEIRVWREKTDA